MQNPMLNPMNMALLQGMQQQPAAPQVQQPTPAASGNWFNKMTSDPMFSMGMGMLGGNYGTNSRSAFANAMQGGLRGMQLASMNQRRNKEMMLEEEKQKQAEAEYAAMQKAHAARVANDPSLAVFGPKNSAAAALEARKQGARQKAIASLQTPEGQASLAYLQQQGGLTNKEAINAYLGGGGTNVTVGGTGPTGAEMFAKKLPTGYTAIPDPNSPGGFKAVKMEGVGESRDAAGSAAMIDSARSSVKPVMDILFKDGDVYGGDINKGALWGKTLVDNDFVNIPGAIVENIDGLQGGPELASLLETGKQAITRTETGATMPSDELGNTIKRFIPTSTDSDMQVRLKMIGYQMFLDNADNYLKSGFSKATKANHYDIDRVFAEAQNKLKNKAQNNSTNETWEDDQYMYRKVPDSNGGFKTQRRKK